MSTTERWLPERQPWRRSCEECRANPEKQVLNGHGDCLPPINGRYTADGVEITVGLLVWDYDLRPGVVTEVDHSFEGTPDGPLGIVAWHMVERCDGGGSGMFDGSRMCTTHPTTHEKPQVFPGPDAVISYEQFITELDGMKAWISRRPRNRRGWMFSLESWAAGDR
jgi:hypothetical protein